MRCKIIAGLLLNRGNFHGDILGQGFVALLMFALGAGASLYQGVDRILHPHAMVDPLVNIVVLGCSLVFEGYSWWVAHSRFAAAKGGLPPPVAGVRHGRVFLHSKPCASLEFSSSFSTKFENSSRWRCAPIGRRVAKPHCHFKALERFQA